MKSNKSVTFPIVFAALSIFLSLACGVRGSTGQSSDGTHVEAIPIDLDPGPGTSKDYSSDGLQQNGANNTIQRSYLWTVPDTLTDSAKVRITAFDGAGNSAFDNSIFLPRINKYFILI